MINVLKVLRERCSSKYFKLNSNTKNYVENEINFFSGELGHLYVKARTFLLPLKAPEILQIYKSSDFNSYTQKTAIAMLQI